MHLRKRGPVLQLILMLSYTEFHDQIFPPVSWLWGFLVCLPFFLECRDLSLRRSKQGHGSWDDSVTRAALKIKYHCVAFTPPCRPLNSDPRHSTCSKSFAKVFYLIFSCLCEPVSMQFSPCLAPLATVICLPTFIQH